MRLFEWRRPPAREVLQDAAVGVHDAQVLVDRLSVRDTREQDLRAVGVHDVDGLLLDPTAALADSNERDQAASGLPPRFDVEPASGVPATGARSCRRRS